MMSETNSCNSHAEVKPAYNGSVMTFETGLTATATNSLVFTFELLAYCR